MMRPRNLDESRYEYAYEALRGADLPNKLVFDCGCGDGGMKRVEELGYTWRGFDHEAWSLATAWNLSDPCPTDDKAGAVMLLDVLEHCISPGLTLQHISNAMVPGGRLILTMPNPRWSGNRIYTFAVGYTSSFTPYDLEENHHILPIWPHSAERLLSYAGFELEDYVTLGGRSRLRLSRLPIDIVRRLMEMTDPAAHGASYGLIARKL
jgi:SAM-dependent methyltransferase